jgi:hypothetical protein
MKSLFLITFLLFLVFSARAQTDSDAYYGNKYIAARMGGGRVVSVDTITPLYELIKKLEKPWDFNETFKAYWIGYTDDMYSIARYKDKAIEKLTDFIDTSHNPHARVGALYTLHLIGINFRVVGRFSEDFESQNARNALLKYLDDDALNETVVVLIKRDPWLSDIPKIMQYLSGENHDYSKILVALQRYEFDGKPLEQKVTDSIFKKEVFVNDANFTGLHSTKTLISFQRALAPYFIIDKEITETAEWQKAVNSPTSEGTMTNKLSFNFIIESSKIFSYCDYEPAYDYVFTDHTIEVIGQEKARQIWLEWWQGLPQSEKVNRFSTNHIK